jgi:tetratricopeptide (TPR) repeat protein
MLDFNSFRWLMFLALVLPLAEKTLAAEQDMIQRAHALDEKEDYAGAAALYEKILAVKPDEYWVTVSLAHDYARLGRLEDTRRTFAKAKEINGKEAAAYIEEGYAFTDAGNNAEAERTWAELIASDTTSFMGYHHMGTTMVREGRLAEAEYYYKESIKRLEAQSDSQAHHYDLMHSLNALAALFWRQGRLGEADAVYRRGVEKSRGDPSNKAQFLAALAEIHASEGRSAKTERLLRRALAVCEPKDACFRTAHANVLGGLAEFYLAHGRRAEATEMADKEAALYDPFGDVPLLAFPFSVQQLASIAALYVSLGDEAKAEGIYRRLIALRSSMSSNDVLADAESLLAERCAKTGRLSEAENLSLDAIGILERRGEWERASSVMDRLADVYRRQGRIWRAWWARRQAKALAGQPRVPRP